MLFVFEGALRYSCMLWYFLEWSIMLVQWNLNIPRSLGIVNDFVYLSNSKIIYMEKNLAEFKDLFLQRNSGRRRNENIILPRPETNFIRNSIRVRGAIAWNSLTNKEIRAKSLKEFKRRKI